jgi:hypothetical protein
MPSDSLRKKTPKTILLPHFAEKTNPSLNQVDNSVQGQPRTLDEARAWRRMIEQPNSGFASIAGYLDEPIEQHALLGAGGCLIARSDPL